MKLIRVQQPCWLTSLKTPGKRKLTLTKEYGPDKYPTYDNYDAIEVSKIKDIPGDYKGVMGIPITILNFDLDNVEIIGCFNNYKEDTIDEENGLIAGTPMKVPSTRSLFRGPVVRGGAKYFRVLIRRKQK